MNSEIRSEHRARGMLAPAKLANPMKRTRCGKLGRNVSIQSSAVSVFQCGYLKTEVLTGPVVDDPQKQLISEKVRQLVVQFQTSRIVHEPRDDALETTN